MLHLTTTFHSRLLVHSLGQTDDNLLHKLTCFQPAIINHPVEFEWRDWDNGHSHKDLHPQTQLGFIAAKNRIPTKWRRETETSGRAAFSLSISSLLAGKLTPTLVKSGVAESLKKSYTILS